ncbi:MAG TPA: signal peptidase II [Nocardioides sp.]|nr:signal peptidase II [Nocardioides sp.]
MQAARGTSLNRWIVPSVGAGSYLLDVGVKTLAVHRLDDGDVHVLGDWFVLHLTRNAGAAFSTGTQYTVALSCLAAVALVVVLSLSRRAGDRVWSVAFGLLAGGIAGNLTDRLFRDPGPLRGHVVDMFMVPHWPVFNVADICINIAAGLIVLQTFRGVSLDGSRRAATSGTG